MQEQIITGVVPNEMEVRNGYMEWEMVIML